LRNLTKKEAEFFRLFCGLSFDGGWVAQLEDPTRKNKLDFIMPPSLDLSAFGVSYDAILVLRAAGLLQDGDGVHKRLPVHIVEDGRRVSVAKNNGIGVVFKLLDGKASDIFEIPAIVPTPAGLELSSLIPHAPNYAYLRRVSEGVAPRKVEMHLGPVLDNGSIEIDEPLSWP
jgi:hypothetical protein